MDNYSFHLLEYQNIQILIKIYPLLDLSNEGLSTKINTKIATSKKNEGKIVILNFKTNNAL